MWYTFLYLGQHQLLTLQTHISFPFYLQKLKKCEILVEKLGLKSLEKVEECCASFHSIVLQTDVIDMWIWQPYVSSEYNVTSIYNYLASLDDNINNEDTIFYWHKEAPLKVNLFVWRLLQNRIPTTYNLINRRVFQPNIQFCLGGCGLQEDIDYLFFFGLATYTVKFGSTFIIGLVWLRFSQLMSKTIYFNLNLHMDYKINMFCP